MMASLIFGVLRKLFATFSAIDFQRKLRRAARTNSSNTQILSQRDSSSGQGCSTVTAPALKPLRSWCCPARPRPSVYRWYLFLAKRQCTEKPKATRFPPADLTELLLHSIRHSTIESPLPCESNRASRRSSRLRIDFPRGTNPPPGHSQSKMERENA